MGAEAPTEASREAEAPTPVAWDPTQA
jgi:hypothetical protein